MYLCCVESLNSFRSSLDFLQFFKVTPKSGKSPCTTNVNVKSDGVTVLGSPVGSPKFVKREVDRKIGQWCDKLRLLADIAQTQPQAAHCAFTHGLFSEWSYMFRTCEIDECQIQPLEECMRLVFIPSLLGREAVNDIERDWLSLPTRFGGLGLYNPILFSSLNTPAQLTSLAH